MQDGASMQVEYGDTWREYVACDQWDAIVKKQDDKLSAKFASKGKKGAGKGKSGVDQNE